MSIVNFKFNYFFKILNNKKIQSLLKKVNLLLAIACIYFIFNTLNKNETLDIVNFEFHLSELFLTLIFYINSGLLWSYFLKENYEGKLTNYFFNWSFSKIGKYIPSGIMTLSVRLNQELENKKNQKTLLFGLLEEQFLIPTIAIPPLLYSLFITNKISYQINLGLSFIFFFLLVKFIFSKLHLGYKSMLSFNLLFILNYVIPILLIYETANNLNYENLILVALSYFLATCVGLLFIGVPAGIGIREFIFISYTSNFLTEPSFVPLILKLRILFLMFDVFFGILGFLYTYKNKKY